MGVVGVRVGGHPVVKAREPRRTASPLGRAVRVVVPQVDAVGQERVAVEMVAATAALAAARSLEPLAPAHWFVLSLPYQK